MTQRRSIHQPHVGMTAVLFTAPRDPTRAVTLPISKVIDDLHVEFDPALLENLIAPTFKFPIEMPIRYDPGHGAFTWDYLA